MVLRFGAASVSLPVMIGRTKGTWRTRAGSTVYLAKDMGVIPIGKVMGRYESVVAIESLAINQELILS